MDIVAYKLGYRELAKIADFINVIKNGNDVFQELVEDGKVVIGYDVYDDSVTVKSRQETLYYPSDFE